MILPISLAIGAVILMWAKSSENRNPKKVAGIYTESQFTSLYENSGMKNLDEICNVVIEQHVKNIGLMGDNEELEEGDALQTIDNTISQIETILQTNRSVLRSHNFLVDGKKNIVDFAEFIMPEHELFKMSKYDLLKYESDFIPDSIERTIYDIAFVSAKKYLLDKRMDDYSIKTNISIHTKNAQMELQNNNKKLFHCYIKHGEKCFNKNRFECVKLYGDECFVKKKFECFVKNMGTKETSKCFE